MAGEYYRWLARDVVPEKKRELTPAEKRRNWWYYHKWHVVIALVCVVMLASVISDALYNSRNEPDYKIAFVGRSLLPEDTVDALEAAFANLGRDLNGNGKVQVEILEYQFYDENADIGPLDMEASAERAYNASMLLMVNVETVESMIYLLEDPEIFAATYPVLTPVGEGGELWYRWGDCPVLSGLELGTFEIPVVGGVAQGDNQLVMENICIACRGLWDDGSNEMTEGALELWAILTDGAK